MTLVQMRHLIALAETGSFRRAAELTFLTQPAFSRSIKALEDELGQRLFDRQGWLSVPTPFGESVLERARRLVQEAEHLKEDLAGCTFTSTRAGSMVRNRQQPGCRLPCSWSR